VIQTATFPTYTTRLIGRSCRLAFRAAAQQSIFAIITTKQQETALPVSAVIGVTVASMGLLRYLRIIRRVVRLSLLAVASSAPKVYGFVLWYLNFKYGLNCLSGALPVSAVIGITV